MSTARAPAHRAPHPPSAADNATAPSTPEASRPESAQGSPAAHEATEPSQRAAAPPHGHPARRPGPVDWPAHLARLDELRSDTGALPRGAIVALADELGVKVGTVYSQMSRRRRDEALLERGRLTARAAALPQHADPSCSDAESQATDPAQTSPRARHQPHDCPPGIRHAVLQRLDSAEAVLVATVPRAPELIHSGSPSPAPAAPTAPTPAAAHRVEFRCPGCAALLTLALADPTCSDPAPRDQAAPDPHAASGLAAAPELIRSGSPSPDQALTLTPHAADPTPELRQGKTSP